jgi:general secretion pathway protein A
MFYEFYELREDPFSLAVPRHLYLGISQRKALASLHYGVEYGGGIQLLLADTGLGKTTVLRYLQKRMQMYDHTVFLSSRDCKDPEFLSHLFTDPMIDGPGSIPSLREDKTNEISTPGGETECRSILLVDDAQDLNDSPLESLRLLAKPKVLRKKHLHIVLAGRPELLGKLLLDPPDTLEQIWIAPFSSAEIEGYINHRLQMAGGCRNSIFTPAAVALIVKKSEGVPKKINNICWTALMTGAKFHLKQIDTPILEDDYDRHIIVPGPPERSFWSRILRRAQLLLTLSFVMVVTGSWYNNRQSLRALTDAVYKTTPSPKTSFDAVPSGPLRQSRNNILKVPISTIISSSEAVPAGKLTGSSIPSYGRSLPSSSAVNRGAPRSALPDPTPAGIVSTPTGAVAAILTSTTPSPSIAYPKLTPSESQFSLTREQPWTSTPVHKAVTVAARPASVQTNIGDDYMRIGQYDKAVNSYETALAHSPGNKQLQQRIERARRAQATEEQILPR